MIKYALKDRTRLWLFIAWLSGALSVFAIWYGIERHLVLMALIGMAKCDDRGAVSVTFYDGGNYTCIPKLEVPPVKKK